jgi:hypothetical protein
VADFNTKFKLVHLCDADNLDVGIRMEVAVVRGVSEEALHLQLQEVDVLERSVESAEDRNLLPHGLASRNVFNPQGVQNNIGNLDRLSVGDALEHGVEKCNVLHGEHLGGDVDTVTDVVRVFGKEENAGTENLLRGGSEDEGQRQESGS